MLPTRRITFAAALMAGLVTSSIAQGPRATTKLLVHPQRLRQEFQGMGCGAIFYEGHFTSLAARGKNERQKELYDDCFTDVNTKYLHLMIRHDHEPVNDNDDPYQPAFKQENFAYCQHTLAICQAARERRPDLELYATLYTPPPWMKTNNEPGGGGEKRGTLKPNLELELAEFCWAFLAHMHKNGQPVQYLSIANEPDWPHTQPSYFLTPDQHAALFAKVAAYLDEMAKRHAELPKVKLVAPNVLSAVNCAEKWLPPLLRKAGKSLDVIGCHDYDRRGNRFKTLADAAGGRSVWVTEWCVNGPDKSPELLNSATEFWLAMTEAFNGGAHAWMAYDWVYPPRQGGEALIHVDWGKDYHPTKIYHAFRQWCSPLQPGMKVVETNVTGAASSDFSKPGVKACAFASKDGRTLVIHAACVQDQSATLELRLAGNFAAHTVERRRTSATEDFAELPSAQLQGSALTEQLPPRSTTTFLLTSGK